MHMLFYLFLILDFSWSLTSPRLFKGNLIKNEREGPYVKVQVFQAMD